MAGKTVRSINKKFPGGVEDLRENSRKLIEKETNLWDFITKRTRQLSYQLLAETIDGTPKEKHQAINECSALSSNGFEAIARLAFYGLGQEWDRLKAQKSLFQGFSLLLELLSSISKLIFATLSMVVRFIATPFDYVFESMNQWIKNGGWTSYLVGNFVKGLVSIPLSPLNRLANLIGYTGNLVDGGMKLGNSLFRALKVVEGIGRDNEFIAYDALKEFEHDFARNGLGRMIKNTLRIAPEAALLSAYFIPGLQPAAALGGWAASQWPITAAMAPLANYAWLGLWGLGAAYLPYDKTINRAINWAVYDKFEIDNQGDPEDGSLVKYRKEQAEEAQGNKNAAQKAAPKDPLRQKEEESETELETESTQEFQLTFANNQRKRMPIPKGYRKGPHPGFQNEGVVYLEKDSKGEPPQGPNPTKPDEKYHIQTDDTLNPLQSIYEIPSGFMPVKTPWVNGTYRNLLALVDSEELSGHDPEASQPSAAIDPSPQPTPGRTSRSGAKSLSPRPPSQGRQVDDPEVSEEDDEDMARSEIESSLENHPQREAIGETLYDPIQTEENFRAPLAQQRFASRFDYQTSIEQAMAEEAAYVAPVARQGLAH